MVLGQCVGSHFPTTPVTMVPCFACHTQHLYPGTKAPPHPRVPPPSLFCCPNWTRRAGPPGITFAPTGVTTIRRRSLVLTRATALHPYLARGCLPSPSNHLPLFAPSRFPMCPKLREPWGLSRGGACPCGLQGWVTKGRHFLGLDSSALSPPQHPPSIGDLPG